MDPSTSGLSILRFALLSSLMTGKEGDNHQNGGGRVVVPSSLSSSSSSSSLSSQLIDINDDICVCSPTVYQWSLDFEQTCSPKNINEGPQEGISSSVCLIYPEDNSSDVVVTDLIPVRTTNIQILELNRNFDVIGVDDRQNLDLHHGDTFSFTSSIVSSSSSSNHTLLDDPSLIPGGFQMRIISKNQNDDTIINDWVVAFTNSCDVAPFQSNGVDSLGWSVFENLEPPLPDLCPLRSTTPAPTITPQSPPTTTSMTSAPTTSMTSAPTTSMTSAPTTSTTPTPVAFPTLPPVPVPVTKKPTSNKPTTSISMSYDYDAYRNNDDDDEWWMSYREENDGTKESSNRRRRRLSRHTISIEREREHNQL